jgi:hypothetical protein
MVYQAEIGYPLEPVETKKWYDFSGATRSFEERMPSLDKSLDRYFSTHIDAIIQEWELLTENDLLSMEGRLKRITEEIGTLEQGHAGLRERALVLDASLKEMGR